MYSIKTIALIALSKEIAEASGLSIRVAGNLVNDIVHESMWHGMPIYLVNVPGNKFPVDLVWGNKAVDIVDSVSNCHWERFPDVEFERMPGTQITPNDVHISERDADFIREKVLQRRVNRNVGTASPFAGQWVETQIYGATMEKLRLIIRDFPEKYPHYATKALQWNSDVKPWMAARYGVSSREQHVFGAIIREHFKLSDDIPG